MIWKMSDVFVLAGTMVLIWNLLITLIILFRKQLERSMNMKQLNILLKAIIMYSFLVMPMIVMITLYKATYHGKFYIEGDDFSYFYVIGKETVSTSTGLGNHAVLYMLFCVWLCGVVFKGILSLIKDSKLLKAIEKCSIDCPNSVVLELKEELAAELKINSPVKIFENAVIESPFTIGLWKKQIFIPTENYTRDEWRLILKHEFIHCKKIDYLFRRIIFLLCSVYWFNPAMEKFSEYFVEINEMACDEAVLEQESMKVHAFYGHLLIKIQEKGISISDAVSLTGHTEDGLDRRIRNIMKKSGKTKRWFVGAISVTMALMVPFISFAVAYGVSSVQDMAVDFVEDEEIIPVPEHVEEKMGMFDESQKVRELDVQITPRGVGYIDITINGKELVKTAAISLSANAMVGLVLLADNSSDKFRAGIMDSNGRETYVEVSNDMIYTFTVKQSGQYTVFWEGTTVNSVHVRGSVTVFD